MVLRQFFRLWAALFLCTISLSAAKIKEVANVVGVRENQLIGYGLVVGLNGSGDGSTSVFTTQSLANLLSHVDMKIDPGAVKSKNIAAVMVTTNIPPFARQGDKLNVLVSSIGDAKSLEGGTLLMTSMKGVDGKIYALAQGTLSIGGFNSGNAKGQKNHTTSASISGGALVEREISYNLNGKEQISLSLKTANFQNAVSLQNAVNKAFGVGVASAADPHTVKLEKPAKLSMVEFLAKVQELDINVDKPSKIIIDEKTGTVVAGADISIEPVVITHGDMTIKIRSKKSDENASNGSVDIGDTASVTAGNGIVTAEKEQMTVSSLMRALQKLGAKPKDVISILQTMKSAGVINADLEVI